MRLVVSENGPDIMELVTRADQQRRMGSIPEMFDVPFLAFAPVARGMLPCFAAVKHNGQNLLTKVVSDLLLRLRATPVILQCIVQERGYGCPLIAFVFEHQ